jgi:hypothetical protein
MHTSRYTLTVATASAYMPAGHILHCVDPLLEINPGAQSGHELDAVSVVLSYFPDMCVCMYGYMCVYICIYIYLYIYPLDHSYVCT